MTTTVSDSPGRRPRLEWLPPLLVGASAATATEVAVGVLLYGGAGMVRSLTTILAVSGLAFACGLWSSPTNGPDLVDRLRKRWLLALFAFLTAAVFGTLWSLYDAIGQGRVGQTAGLALMAALPLFASGAVVGGITVAAASDRGRRLRSPGASVAVGAALGVIATGYLLPRAPIPASLLVGCLVLLSLGGMVFGGVLGARTESETLASRPAHGTSVSVVETRRDIDGLAVRELTDGRFVRRRMAVEGSVRQPWDVAAVRVLLPDLDAPVRILMLGAGASSAPNAIVREHPLGMVLVLERTAAVVELGRDFFSTALKVGREDRLGVEVGNLDDLITSTAPMISEHRFDVVVVDTRALAPIGGCAGIARESWGRLYGGLSPGGVFVWGPLSTEAGSPEVPEGWAHSTFSRGPNSSVAEHVTFVREGLDVPMPDAPQGFDR